MNPNVQIESIHASGYLNLINQTMKDMQIPQTINQFVSYDAQCRVTPGDVAQMIVMDMLAGRQALVHMQIWAQRLDLDKLVSPGLEASFFTIPRTHSRFRMRETDAGLSSGNSFRIDLFCSPLMLNSPCASTRNNCWSSRLKKLKPLNRRSLSFLDSDNDPGFLAPTEKSSHEDTNSKLRRFGACRHPYGA